MTRHCFCYFTLAITLDIVSLYSTDGPNPNPNPNPSATSLYSTDGPLPDWTNLTLEQAGHWKKVRELKKSGATLPPAPAQQVDPRPRIEGATATHNANLSS